MNPTVSVCIPTYNRAPTLAKTITAVLNQTFSDLELIVSDDASTDETEQIVRAFNDERVRYYRSASNLGLYPNWNKCLELASGKYVAIYHDHDLYLPTIVERSVELLEKYPTASFVHTALLLIDSAGKPVGMDIRPFPELVMGEDLKRRLATQWSSPVMAATAMVRRTAYEEVGFYNYRPYGLGCDMDMWLKLCHVGDVAYVQEPQVFIRARAKGDSTAQFNWSEVVKSFHMHSSHLAREFTGQGVDYYVQRVRHAFQRDKRLLMYGLRAVLLESPEVVSEGLSIIRSEAGPWIERLVRLVDRSAFLQSILRNTFLPLHYTRVARWHENQQLKVEQYLLEHQSLREQLDAVQA